MAENFKQKNQKVLDNIHSVKGNFKILLAEAEDVRVIEAASIIEKLGITELTLVGNREKINSLIEESGLTMNFKVLDPKKTYSKKMTELAKLLYEKRKHKGMTLAEAEQLILNDTKYFSAALVENGDYDAFISGNICSTAETIRAAIHLLETKQGYASSHFLMLTNKGPLLFADCAFNVNPSAEELAKIALQTAKSAEIYGLTPKIAFLSHSTKGSANNPDEQKVVEAVKEFEKLLLKEKKHYVFDGELQVDSAIVPEVADKKNSGSSIKGDANIFVFPNLDSGNIGYKLVERLGNAKAIGPIIQGLKKEAHDLSRGCSAEDIVDLVAITCKRLDKK